MKNGDVFLVVVEKVECACRLVVATLLCRLMQVTAEYLQGNVDWSSCRQLLVALVLFQIPYVRSNCYRLVPCPFILIYVSHKL